MSERVILLGLDFGSTTSSALLASAKVARSSATGHTQLDDVQVLYKSEPVFTPFANQIIDTKKVAKLIENWLDESGVKVADIFSGGSMITGLAAQSDNAAALSKLIINMVGESVVATADDPCLESWLAFMGSCGALSRYLADTPIINFDIGGGTTNVALGVNGDVQQTGCYFIGARHFKFVSSGYELTAISSYGETLLADLKIKKTIGEKLSEDEVARIMAFYVLALEAIALGDNAFFDREIAQKHSQVAIQFDPKIKTQLTFSGGVGELIYKISANEILPTTTFYGDFGIDLAKAICNSTILSTHLKTCVPEHKGRATVVGLTLHSTEISGNTVYLPKPNCLPLCDLPIVAKLPANATTEQWQSALALAASRKLGACIQISACDNNLEQIRALATQIKHALDTNIHAGFRIRLSASALSENGDAKHWYRPLVILVEANIGKALGNYISNWGQLDYNLMVIDEVTLRDAHFVHIGRLHQGMIPVSFYGLN